MNIEIGDKYVVTADQYQYILNERKIVKEGKNAGGEYQQTIGYYPKISHLVSALLHLVGRTSEVQSLEALEKYVERVAGECELAFKGE
ncbi:DUF5405 family protein [Mixta calida]